MRDYAYHQSEVSGGLPGSGIIARLWQNWQARRAIASLDRLDDFILRDLGYIREDIRMASHTPLSQNAVLALEELSGQRRLSYGRNLRSPAPQAWGRWAEPRGGRSDQKC
jgi:uncharacterized protein YjiS (DUF1127 family)